MKNTMQTKTIIWLFISVMGVAQAIAGSKGHQEHFSSSNEKYRGRVIDNEGESLPFANVVLLYPESREIIVGAVTDFDGNFELLPKLILKKQFSKYLPLVLKLMKGQLLLIKKSWAPLRLKRKFRLFLRSQ
jgi:hypothetical protein